MEIETLHEIVVKKHLRGYKTSDKSLLRLSSDLGIILQNLLDGKEEELFKSIADSYISISLVLESLKKDKIDFNVYERGFEINKGISKDEFIELFRVIIETAIGSMGNAVNTYLKKGDCLEDIENVILGLNTALAIVGRNPTDELEKALEI